MHLPDFIYNQKAIICCAIGFIAGLITDRSPLLTVAQVVLLVVAAVITQLRSSKKSTSGNSSQHQNSSQH